jgi:hypothetical protein
VAAALRAERAGLTARVAELAGQVDRLQESVTTLSGLLFGSLSEKGGSPSRSKGRGGDDGGAGGDGGSGRAAGEAGAAAGRSWSRAAGSFAAGDRGTGHRCGYRPAVLSTQRLLSWRNQQHPLHGLLGQASRNDHVRYLSLHRLSQEAVLNRRAGNARLLALAREAGDPAIISHALTNIGLSQLALGDPGGQPTMDEALRVALDAGDVEDACRAYVGIAWHLLDWFRLGEAERYLTASMRLAEEAEFLGFLSYMQVERARLEFSRGSWDGR